MIANEIFYYGVTRYFDQISSHLSEGKSAEDRVRIFVESAIKIISENREFFKIYVDYMIKEAESPDVKKMVTTFYDRYTGTLMELINEGIAAGAFRKVESDKLARAIYFLTIGVLFTRFTMKVEFDVESQSRFQVASILDSIRK